MKKSIVFKWFVMTALLFSMMFLFIGITQNYFFEKYYIHKKSDRLMTVMKEFEEQADEKGYEAASKELYQNDHIWITDLDEYGQINEVGDYYIEVALENDTKASEHLINWKIPMYTFEGEYSSDVISTSFLKAGDHVRIDTIILGEERLPYMIQTETNGVVNLSLANKLHGPNADVAYQHLGIKLYQGTITKTVFPGQASDMTFPYSEHFFLEQIKKFQVDLLAPDAKPISVVTEFNAKENFTDYRIVVQPYTKNERTGYLFAMTSLQPVDEAIMVSWQFYPYFFTFAFLCVALLAFGISRWLAKPLLSMNQVTKKISELDFSEKLPIYSEDEIGQLSGNINSLSCQIEAYIGELEQDLKKEKQLENTRKEFIAGVSHELKTPLAVMKSCLSIVRDGIAVEKREHYFQAMEEEIQRMDSLVVNMLDLAKFESGTYKPEMNPFAIDQVIREVCQSFDGQLQEKEIALTLEIVPRWVEGHRGLISRVITNFLSNAICHTEKGQEIAIRMEQENQAVKISVENHGKPISEEDKKKIWDQFYRVEARTAKAGTGLGLSISKEILMLHDAPYGVENTKDGVRFTFSLPVYQNDELIESKWKRQ